jgi:hypothetical protein
MHTGTKVLKLVIVSILLFGSFYGFSQDVVDTVNIKPFERYWTQPRLIPRLGLGVEDGGFVEAGIALHKIYVHPLSLASACPYLTFEGVILENDIIYGSKLGYEITAGLLGIAADVTYYTDFDKKSFMFTPKAGISVLGFANLFYGYNIVLSDESFKSIDKNRFSLTFNINKDYFNLKAAHKRKHQHHVK